MLVKGPPFPRRGIHLLPIYLPATVFGSAERITGGCSVYHHGHINDVTNITVTSLEPEDITYAKGHFHLWGAPAAPLKPPESHSWDAARANPQGYERGYDVQ